MIALTPLKSPVDLTLRVPGSKSLTQRALICAALAQGKSELLEPLASEDTHLLVNALRSLGMGIDDHDPDCWHVKGCGGQFMFAVPELYLGNNGTATRLLSSVAALGRGEIRLGGDERMAQRPIAPLISALQGWGVAIWAERDNGCPPLAIQAAGIKGGHTILPPGKSSQYLSSLLLVAPYAANEANISVQGELYSRPYIDMTLAVMRSFGVEIAANDARTHFHAPQGRYYQGRVYAIEGDASSASYFWAAAALCGGRVQVSNVPQPSLQGDARFLELLTQMGCCLHQDASGVSVQGSGNLRGIEVDMGDMPDLVPTLAVLAAFAQGTSVIKNIEHLRIKETDRLSAVAHELRKLGAEVEEEEAALRIHGQGGANLRGARISTYNDHRMAMSFALAGLRLEGVEIENEGCVAKSFPDFWQRFARLRGENKG